MDCGEFMQTNEAGSLLSQLAQGCVPECWVDKWLLCLLFLKGYQLANIIRRHTVYLCAEVAVQVRPAVLMN